MRLTFVYCMACLAVLAFLGWGMFGAATDPTYQQGLTARKIAVEQTKRVEAQEWGATARVWGMWGFPAAAVVGGAALAGWTIVEWQRNRTRRHEATEDHTTQRHLISAKRDIAMAYIAQCGDSGAYAGRLNGMQGVFLPESNEFVPLHVCRAELAQRPMLTVSTQQEDWYDGN